VKRRGAGPKRNGGKEDDNRMPDSLIKDLTKPKGATEQTASVKIKIGANEYLINVKRIPYFESFLSFQSKSG
jgi:hypothetical protein